MWYALKQDGTIVTVEFFKNTPSIYDFALIPNGICSWKKYEIVNVEIKEI